MGGLVIGSLDYTGCSMKMKKSENIKHIVFACGNPSRGDDALGPLLLQAIQALELTSLTLIEDFQLHIEHAWDLQGHQQALFIDAHQSCPPPFIFAPVLPAQDVSYTSHALSPQAVLKVYADVWQKPPPPAFMLGIRAYEFELGSPLTPAAQHHLAQAIDWVKDYILLQQWHKKTLTYDASCQYDGSSPIKT